MRLLIAAITLIAGAAPPAATAQPPAPRSQCRTAPDAAAVRARAQPRRLGELPPGRPWRAVYRLEDGCPAPVALPVARRPR